MQKSLARNSIYCIAYKLLSIGYPLITTVYISRILLPEGIGKIALVRTFVSYFTTLAALGIPNYGIKLIGSVQKIIDCEVNIFLNYSLLTLYQQ